MVGVDTFSYFWQRDDLVDKYNLTAQLDIVNAIRAERFRWLERDCWRPVRDAFRQLPCPDSLGGWDVQLDGDYVSVLAREAISDAERGRVEQVARLLHPWRKGPFRIFDLDIDAEWRSHRKWDRVAPALGDLREARILDVGCGNGYYMFRAAAQDPRLVLGIDPSVAFLFQFELIQHFLRDDRLQYELLGVEHLELFQKTFDVALCMGIVYHHRNPIDILRRIYQSLRVGGRCLLESQSIPGDDPVALFPEDRYAKARNVFFVPTAKALMNWMIRAGFKDVRLVSHEPVTSAEQRRTEWMTFESLTDFLDPEDSRKTIEGYPAPWRTAVSGIRAN